MDRGREGAGADSLDLAAETVSPAVMPTVSVIVPNYNHERYLRRRIESVLCQTYRDFEVILLDDCSTDKSRSILSGYVSEPRVRLAFNEKNSGSTFRQWNKGMRMARGRYVWIAESDDYADPGFLTRMVRILEEQTEVTFAYCRSWMIGEENERLGFSDWYLDDLHVDRWTADFVADGIEECRRFFVLANPVPNASAVLLRKQVYEKVGGADERFRICGDYNLWAAMALGGKIAYVAEPMNYFRSHRESVRSRTQGGGLDVAEYFYVMLSILVRVAPPDTVPPEASALLSGPPFTADAQERILASQRSLSYIAEWNLRQNRHIPRKALRFFLVTWEFALVGRGFAISPPTRWRFFLHRYRFYQRYFSTMGWKLRVVNLMRAFGAPIIGYRHRHWPEKVYARVMRILGAR
jgi:glycosyltransferase involved in cell wall biosynthesis